MDRNVEAPILGVVPLGTTMAIALAAFGLGHVERSGVNLLAVTIASAFVWAIYELAIQRLPARLVARAIPLLIAVAAVFTFTAMCATVAYSWASGRWW